MRFLPFHSDFLEQAVPLWSSILVPSEFISSQEYNVQGKKLSIINPATSIVGEFNGWSDGYIRRAYGTCYTCKSCHNNIVSAVMDLEYEIMDKDGEFKDLAKRLNNPDYNNRRIRREIIVFIDHCIEEHSEITTGEDGSVKIMPQKPDPKRYMNLEEAIQRIGTLERDLGNLATQYRTTFQEVRELGSTVSKMEKGTA